MILRWWRERVNVAKQRRQPSRRAKRKSVSLRVEGLEERSLPSVTHLGVSAPADVKDLTPYTVTVSARDASDNIVNGYTGTIHFTSTDPTDPVIGDYTLTAGDQGVHIFRVTSVATGTHTFTAADVATPGLTAGAAVTVAFTTNQDLVDRAYRTLLGRPADLEGLLYWSSLLEAGTPRDRLALTLVHSPEYYITNVLAPAYQHYLGRPADTAGQDYWVDRLEHGLSDEQLEAAFLGSREFYQANGGTDEGWVAALYRTLLARDADTAGQAFWVGVLAGGATRAGIALGFTAGLEREALRVQHDYDLFLGRRASEAEVAFWVNAFRQGMSNEAVLAGFIASDEFFQRGPYHTPVA